MSDSANQRVDELVGTVGNIRGDVQALRNDMGRATNGIEELRGAMTVLTRHSLALEATTEATREMRSEINKLEARQQATDVVIAAEIPPLKELRTYVLRAVMVVLSVVGLGILALVVKT